MPQKLTHNQSTWIRKWLGTVRNQTITWINVDQVWWCHMASLYYNELTYCSKHHSLVSNQKAKCYQRSTDGLAEDSGISIPNNQQIPKPWTRPYIELCFFVVFLSCIVMIGLAFLAANVDTILTQMAFSVLGSIGGPIAAMFTLGMLFPFTNSIVCDFFVIFNICILRGGGGGGGGNNTKSKLSNVGVTYNVQSLRNVIFGTKSSHHIWFRMCMIGSGIGAVDIVFSYELCSRFVPFVFRCGMGLLPDT